MTINRNNFEAYLLDYLEGNLDPLLTADLMAFLAENPEFEKYIPDFEIQPLIAHSGEFNNKQILRKDFPDIPNINQENFDEFCIAFCEGLLGEKDSQRLKEYIAQHNEKQKDLDLFRTLKLRPDLSIGFPGKSELKKPAGRYLKLHYLYLGLSIAASVTLILLLALNRKSPGIQEISSTHGATLSQPVSIPSEESPLPGSENSLQSKSVIAAIKDIPIADTNSSTAGEIVMPSPLLHELQRDDMQLASLEPITTDLPPVDLRQEIVLSKTGRALNEPELPRKGTRAEWIDSESLLGTLISKINLWKTAETAIDGFNYLTEAQLSITKTTDENGNLRGLVLNTESYSIETK